jgi:hypothetical protein
MSTGDTAATHVGSAAVNVTEMPPAGAAIGDPALSNRICMSVPKFALMVAEAWTMFRFAVVETLD